MISLRASHLVAVLALSIVNTGDQVHSGTIVGSAPVVIHDQFRLEANPVTGEESGRVYLFDHIAGPKVRCELAVTGTTINILNPFRV